MMIHRIENIEDFIVTEAREQRNNAKMLDLLKGVEKAKIDNDLLEKELIDMQNFFSSLNEDS